MSNYDKYMSSGQSQPLPGLAQVKNDAGAYVFSAPEDALVKRFLLLGTENGTYYASEKELTLASVKKISDLMQRDGLGVLKITEGLIEANTMPKPVAALLVLALATASKDDKVRARAYDLIPRFASTSTHLFMHLSLVQSIRGWSRGLRRAVGRFYLDRSPEQIAYQMLKYRSREGWTHRDVLRLSHPKPADGTMSALFKFAVDDEIDATTDLPQILRDYVEVNLPSSTTEARLTALKDSSLTWEMVPTELLRIPETWKVLVSNSLLPYTAMLRNLGRMTNLGLLGASDQVGITGLVVGFLTDPKEIRSGRVHPAGILNALRTYAQGRGEKGSLSWSPSPRITDALNLALERSMGFQVPTGKRILYAVDVSGSMQSTRTSGLSLSSAEAAATLATVMLRSEPKSDLAWFNTQAKLAQISRSAPYEQVLQAARLGGGTDCSAPYLMALSQNIVYDAIVILTDSQTTGGSFHPIEAWNEYKRRINPNAKTVVVGMAANNFTLFPEDDMSALSITGMDTTVSQVISAFLKD